MKKRKVVALSALIGVLCAFTVFGCSSQEDTAEEASQETQQEEEPEEENGEQDDNGRDYRVAHFHYPDNESGDPVLVA